MILAITFGLRGLNHFVVAADEGSDIQRLSWEIRALRRLLQLTALTTGCSLPKPANRLRRFFPYAGPSTGRKRLITWVERGVMLTALSFRSRRPSCST